MTFSQGYFHVDRDFYMSFSTNGSQWKWANGILSPKGWQPQFGSCAGYAYTNRTYMSANQTFCETTDTAVSAYTLCESLDNVKKYNSI
jgi:hypothetical protein